MNRQAWKWCDVHITAYSRGTITSILDERTHPNAAIIRFNVWPKGHHTVESLPATAGCGNPRRYAWQAFFVIPSTAGRPFDHFHPHLRDDSGEGNRARRQRI